MFEMNCFGLKVFIKAFYLTIFWETYLTFVLYCICITVVTASEARKLKTRPY